MPTSVPGPSIAAFTSQYDQYLLRVRGSAVYSDALPITRRDPARSLR
jgi:hypothetical protein